MTFACGKPRGGIEKIGRAPNRRGTTVRFKPDPQIFGEDAAFDPARLFRMTRAKAYLFGGVEIRWTCAKELLRDKEIPASATLHFPGGLKDYLASGLEKTTRVHPEIFAGRSDKKAGHGSAEWAVAFVADADSASLARRRNVRFTHASADAGTLTFSTDSFSPSAVPTTVSVVPASTAPICFQLLSGELPASTLGARSSVRAFTVAVVPSADTLTRRSAGTNAITSPKAVPCVWTRAQP